MRLLLLNHHCLLHAHLLNKQNLSHRSSKLNQIPYDDLSRVRTFNSRQSIVKTIHITTTIYHMFDLPAHTIPISLFSSTTSWFPSGNGPPLNFRKILPFSHCPQASHILLFVSLSLDLVLFRMPTEHDPFPLTITLWKNLNTLNLSLAPAADLATEYLTLTEKIQHFKFLSSLSCRSYHWIWKSMTDNVNALHFSLASAANLTKHSQTKLSLRTSRAPFTSPSKVGL